MYTFLLIILILDSLILIAAILLQAAKGGGLASSFGGVTTAADALIGTRQAGNVLSKATWWAGGIFLGLAFLLQLMSTRPVVPSSILDQPAPSSQQPAAPPASKSAPVVPLEKQTTPPPANPSGGTPKRP
jgi:preprotein translocase subunit SecG